MGALVAFSDLADGVPISWGQGLKTITVGAQRSTRRRFIWVGAYGWDPTAVKQGAFSEETKVKR